jgi:hypothetical protein
MIRDEVKSDIETGDAGRIARRLGGIIANDERIRETIAAALRHGKSNDKEVLAAVAAEITKGL